MLLLLKLVLVPTLIATVTLATRRWGPRVGGFLTALPLVAGPTLFFYSVEQGAAFGSRAAQGSLLALLSTSAFALVYAHTARRLPWPVALTLATLAWGAVSWAVSDVAIALVPSLVAVAAACWVSTALLPRLPEPVSSNLRPRWDLAIRMSGAAALVVALTAIAEWLGPTLSGLLASFPVATTVLIGVTHAQRGPAAVVAFFRGFLPMLPLFGVFCVVLSLALTRTSIAIAFAAALGVQFVLQAATFWWTNAAR